MRRPPLPDYRRERIATADDDFLDLDWLCCGFERLVIISHGLEGDSRRAYVTGMANAFRSAAWDVLAWNFRGCSGELNARPRFTHNGSSEDLGAVVEHAVAKGRYRKVVLVGFSMGGNLSLVYLGRKPGAVPEQVRGAAVFSVPCDLAAAADRLAEPSNRIYMQRFLRLMGKKVMLQSQRYPELFPVEGYRQLRTFHQFDARYTAPLHGFSDECDYWAQSSSLGYLAGIRIPAWIINARNDPFLPEACYPKCRFPEVTLLAPDHGGHCGFSLFGNGGRFWSEELALSLMDAV
jgi:predicted alpha/beta-fold hydrolase